MKGQQLRKERTINTWKTYLDTLSISTVEFIFGACIEIEAYFSQVSLIARLIYNSPFVCSKGIVIQCKVCINGAVTE